MAKSNQFKPLMMAGIITLIASGFLFYLLMLYEIGIGISLMLTAAMALFSMTLALISFGYAHLVQRRAFTGKKQATATTDAHQQRIVEIDLPFDAAYDLALAAIQSLDGQDIPMPDDPLLNLAKAVSRKQDLKLHETDRAIGSIKAGLRSRIMGIGDVADFSRIEVQLQRVDNQTTRIRIDSQPNFNYEAFDLGRNLHYVNHITLFLRRESQHSEAESRLTEHAIHEEIPPDDDSSASMSKR